LTFADTIRRNAPTLDAEPNQFVHHGLGAVQAELLIVVIGAAIVGMTFDDDGQIVFLLEALGGKENLTFAEVGQIGRIKGERDGWKDYFFNFDCLFDDNSFHNGHSFRGGGCPASGNEH
jgi:hypothetical protein